MAELLSVWLLGVVVGICSTWAFIIILTRFGTLNIDSSDPEKDVYSIDIRDLDTIKKKKYIWLKINSQK